MHDSIHLIDICPCHNKKYLTPLWKSDCCMTSIVQARQIFGSAGNSDKMYTSYRYFVICPRSPGESARLNY